jgi:arylsulfatase A-like enzyme
MLRRVTLALASALALTPFLHAAESPAARAEHVVLVVWDGMRPDFIAAEYTPTLHALAKSGTFFNNNHSVYITSTEVNGAAIATGCYPTRTGILANREYRPAVDPLKAFGTESAKAMQVTDAARGGKYIGVKTIAELVQAAGGRTTIAGTKPVALLHDRLPEKLHGSAILFAGKSYPEKVAKDIAAPLGPLPDFPPIGTVAPNTDQNAWTTRALTEELWKDGVPKFSTLWLGDPDFTQHLTQPGSPTALAAIRNSDTNLATVLAALEAKGVRGKTDIFVVSDHAFSTVNRTVDLLALFKAAGFTLVREYKTAPQPGQVLLISLGGSCQLYVPSHDAALIQRLVTFLQAGDFAGPIFTRTALPGTFTLHEARMDSPDSADIVFSFRWSDARNKWGTPGSFVAEGRKPGYGTHASLSRFDVRNTLVAAGPDIRAGFVDELPTGNVDVAPTILHLLGITPTEARDGRVLTEALAAVDWDAPKPVTKVVTAESKVGSKTRRQYLKITTLGESSYLDEGNAATEP